MTSMVEKSDRGLTEETFLFPTPPIFPLRFFSRKHECLTQEYSSVRGRRAEEK